MNVSDLNTNTVYFVKVSDMNGWTGVETVTFTRLSKCYGICDYVSKSGKSRVIKYRLYEKNDKVYADMGFYGRRELLTVNPGLTEGEQVRNNDYIGEMTCTLR